MELRRGDGEEEEDGGGEEGADDGGPLSSAMVFSSNTGIWPRGGGAGGQRMS
jgi:hypothetical protein